MSGFKEIVGHEQIVSYIMQAIQSNKVSHAYVMDGEKGAGKKMLALSFAMALQCEAEHEKPCGTCLSCVRAEHENHPDIIVLTHEKPNSIGVEDVREQLVHDMQIKPYSSPYKIYIVPDAEKMTIQAQNAILKTIEEPPSYGIIILLANNANRFLPTILSRCVMFSLKPVSDAQVREYLMTHLQIADDQMELCVAFAQGNIGKAIRLASSESFYEIKRRALYLLQHVSKMPLHEIISAVKEVSEYKVDIQDYLDILAVWYRDLLYFKATKHIDGIILKDQIAAISEQAKKASYEGVSGILGAIQKANERLRANVNFDLTIELLFLFIKDNMIH